VSSSYRDKPIPLHLENLVPGDMSEDERKRRWFAYMDARERAVEEFGEARGEIRRSALKHGWDEAAYSAALGELQVSFHEAEIKDKEILKSPSAAPTGTCYPDAWRYVMRHTEAQPVLVHGTVVGLSGRLGHAWVELPDGTLWDPASQVIFAIERYYELVDPIVEDRYTVDEAATMLNVGWHGPWTAEERMKHIGR